MQVSDYTAEALVGQPHKLVRHTDRSAEACRDLWATLKSGPPWTALVKNRRKDGDHYRVRANVTPVLEVGRVTGYMSLHTVPSRDQVAQADRLHTAMRAEAAAGTLVHTLQQGELQVAGLRGQLARALRPGLGGQRMLVALAGSAASAVAKPPAWWPTAWAQVNAAVAELDGLTQQNAAMVEELAAAAQSMCGQANVVTQAVRIFRG